MSTFICSAISYDMPCLFELGEKHCPYCDRQNLFSQDGFFSRQVLADEKSESSRRELVADEKNNFEKSSEVLSSFQRLNFRWSGMRSAMEIIREARLLQDPSKEPDLSDVDPQGVLSDLKVMGQ